MLSVGDKTLEADLKKHDPPMDETPTRPQRYGAPEPFDEDLEAFYGRFRTPEDDAADRRVENWNNALERGLSTGAPDNRVFTVSFEGYEYVVDKYSEAIMRVRELADETLDDLLYSDDDEYYQAYDPGDEFDLGEYDPYGAPEEGDLRRNETRERTADEVARPDPGNSASNSPPDEVQPALKRVADLSVDASPVEIVPSNGPVGLSPNNETTTPFHPPLAALSSYCDVLKARMEDSEAKLEKYVEGSMNVIDQGLTKLCACTEALNKGMTALAQRHDQAVTRERQDRAVLHELASMLQALVTEIPPDVKDPRDEVAAPKEHLPQTSPPSASSQDVVSPGKDFQTGAPAGCAPVVKPPARAPVRPTPPGKKSHQRSLAVPSPPTPSTEKKAKAQKASSTSDGSAKSSSLRRKQRRNRRRKTTLSSDPTPSAFPPAPFKPSSTPSPPKRTDEKKHQAPRRGPLPKSKDSKASKPTSGTTTPNPPQDAGPKIPTLNEMEQALLAKLLAALGKKDLSLYPTPARPPVPS